MLACRSQTLAVAFVPSPELPQTLPVAIIITMAARMVATARLRSPLGKKQLGSVVGRSRLRSLAGKNQTGPGT